jgi:hypothetical protein
MSAFQARYEALHLDPAHPALGRPGAHLLPPDWIERSPWFRRYPEVAPPATPPVLPDEPLPPQPIKLPAKKPGRPKGAAPPARDEGRA